METSDIFGLVRAETVDKIGSEPDIMQKRFTCQELCAIMDKMSECGIYSFDYLGLSLKLGHEARKPDQKDQAYDNMKMNNHIVTHDLPLVNEKVSLGLTPEQEEQLTELEKEYLQFENPLAYEEQIIDTFLSKG